jgi:hypothetical protein
VPVWATTSKRPSATGRPVLSRPSWLADAR